MTRDKKIRLLLVDDHFIVRMGLRGSLEQEPDLVVVGEAGTAREGIERFRSISPDVTLMDGNLPDQHGTDAIQRIRADDPAARIILLSIDEGEESIHRAVEAGACGYLTKSTSREELLEAIRTVHRIGRYFGSEVAASIAGRRCREPLSERETAVLRLAMKGFSNKLIAAELRITEATVKGHMSHVLSKLEVPDRTRAVAVAIERGILRLE